MPIDKMVLIIDDDLGFTYLLQKTLLKCGVNSVDSVPSGREAAQYIAGLPPYQMRPMPDLLFVDLKMAGIEGLELIQWLQRDPLYMKIPIVILSGSSDPIDRERSLALGVQAFYEKPMEQAKLTGIVEKVLKEFFSRNY